MTEQKRTGREEGDAELFRLLAENVRDYAIFVVDAEGLVRTWGRGAERLLGYREEEIIGQAADRFFTPEDIEKGIPRQEMRQSLATGRGEDDRWHVRKDGSRIWCSGVMTVLKDEGGGLRGFAKIMRDRTEWKLAEERRRFQAQLLDAVGQAVIATAPDGIILYWNRFAEVLYGWPRGEAVGRNVMDVIVPQATAEQGAEIMSRLRAGQQWSGEFLVRRRDGTTFPALVTDTPVFDEEGGLQAIVGVSSDITERKRVEDALRESEERFRASFDQAAVGVAHVGLDDRTLWANPGLCRMLGYTEAEMHERGVLDVTYPDDLEADLALAQRVWAGEIPSYRMEKRYLHQNGSVVWADLAVSLVRDAAGGPKYLVGVVVDITDRKQAEAELRQSEEHLRAVVQTTPECVKVVAADGTVLDINPAGLAIVDADCLEQVTSKSVYDLISEEYQDAYRAFNERVCRGEKGSMEYEIVSLRGTRRRMETHAAPLRGPGRCFRHLAITHDITERNRAEEELRQAHAELERRVAERTEALARSEKALREQTRLLQSILNSIGEGVIVADHRGRILYFNPAAERVHDFDPTDLLSEGYSAKHGFFYADGKTPVATQDLPLARAIRGDMPCDLQFLVRNHRSPEGRVVIATATPLQSEDGSLRGGVVVVRDISNIKRTEAALRESEERFRNTFVSSPVGMWVVGMDHRWVEVNPMLCEMVGRTEEEMLGTTFRAITHPPEELAAELAITAKLVAGEITHFQLEKRYLHKRGHEVCCVIGVGLVRDGEGEPLYFVGHSFDITDRKAAEEKVKESLAEKEVLLREIHHRVKNNLQIISSLLRMQAQQSKDPPVREMFRASQNRVRSMALVHERLYRSDNLAKVDFAAYVNGLTDDLLHSYRADGLVTFRTDVRGVQLPIDTAMPCGLAINELVSNCLKHAFPDGREGEVRIELGPADGGKALLCVRDNGVGLPADVDVRNAESFGLRLVAALVDQLGGSVEIERRAGATFRITFPLRN